MNLDTANARLNRVKIRIGGGSLYLRATLPPKPGEQRRKQRDVATGCPNTPKGIEIALGKALKLESDLLLERFDWANWADGAGGEKPAIKTIEDWTTEFEARHWEILGKTPSREKQYQQDYGRCFRLLPPDVPLSAEVLRKKLTEIPADTRNREVYFIAYTALARLAEIELPWDWRKLKGKWAPTERRIPSDEEILEVWAGLKGPWQWVYGVMAAYGLRNHEVFRLNLTDYPLVRVLEPTKTGARVVYPLHKDWPDRFNLKTAPEIPNISPINMQNGRRVNGIFRVKKVPFSPYCLRHAYGIRAARLGISPAIVAQWMGHSLSVHSKTYLRWIQESDFGAVWEKLD